MKTLYLECVSGISGDMTVGALLDLGADFDVMKAGLDSLGVEGYSLRVERVNKSGIDACKFDVLLDSGEHEHSHENHEHHHGHDHPHEHDHEHPHVHEHVHSGHSHDHRALTDIEALIRASSISERARSLALSIFRIVAEAEGKIHGKPPGEVHFHEVGAVDSIVDIVGTAICIDNLGIERVLCSPLREGTGTVRCQHGIMPVPAPATLEIIRRHNIPLIITDNKGEMVTPTGAAIVAALAEGFDPPGAVSVKNVGYGAGTKEFKTANVVRAIVLEEASGGSDQVIKLECNLDDMTGEALSYACEKLLESGALDCWTTAIQMKKGRPGQMLSVLCRPDQETALAELLFLHTSTIGLRVSRHSRHVMERRETTIDTAYGTVPAKESRRGAIVKVKAEFDALKNIADGNDIPLCRIL